MKKTAILFIFSGLIMLSISACNNILEPFATESDESLLADAKIHMDKYEWDLAIAKFADMSENFLTGRDVKLIHASAYAGKLISIPT